MMMGTWSTVSQEHTIPELEKLGEKGSRPAAKYAEALTLFTSIVKRIQREIKTGSDSVMKDVSLQEQFILDLAKVVEIDTKIPQWIIVGDGCEMLILAQSISSSVFKALNASTRTDLDIASRFCQLYFSMMDDPLKTLESAREHIQKYPDTEFFYFMEGCMLGYLRKMEEGAEVSKKALEKFPKSLSILYNIACCLKHAQKVTIGERIDAWKTYLTLADPSERHVPKFWYEIGILTATEILEKSEAKCGKRFTRAVNTIKSAFQKGEQAEKVILPCNATPTDKDKIVFLKLLLEDTISEIVPLKAYLDCEDGMIRKMFLDHRSLLYFKNDQKKLEYAEKISMLEKMVCGQSYKVSSASLKPMYLEEMKIDNIYKGRILKLTSVEPVYQLVNECDSSYKNGKIMITLSLIAEDITGDVVQCHILNSDCAKVNPEEMDIQKILGTGCKFSIPNPYLLTFLDKISKEKRFELVVDGSADESIILHPEERIERLCNYCGLENAALECCKCKMAFYCDAHCQKRDWKVFGHRNFCSKMAN